MENASSIQTVVVKDTTANPAPLGLLGFGMTTVLLNLHNAGFYKLNSMILAMGICYGGIAQIFAGIFEWKKNNTFGATAFLSYGLFWLSLVVLLIMPKMGLGDAPNDSAWAAYLLAWGVFTGVMFIGTLKLNCYLQFVFGSLTLLFVLLALGHILLALGNITGNTSVTKLAGYEGIICGASAMYTGLYQILKELYAKKA
jgi:uncharacterized protein